MSQNSELEPEAKPVNPYSSPAADSNQKPFRKRFVIACRRAAKAYADEIRQQQLTPVGHFWGWMGVFVLCLLLLFSTLYAIVLVFVSVSR